MKKTTLLTDAELMKLNASVDAYCDDMRVNDGFDISDCEALALMYTIRNCVEEDEKLLNFYRSIESDVLDSDEMGTLLVMADKELYETIMADDNEFISEDELDW